MPRGNISVHSPALNNSNHNQSHIMLTTPSQPTTTSEQKSL